MIPSSLNMTITTSQMKPCPFCAEKIKAEAKKCRHCSEFLSPELRLLQQPQRKAASPGVAAVLSVFLPGLGHIYLGQFGIGFSLMFIVPFGYLFFIVPGLLLHVFAVYSAYRDASGTGQSMTFREANPHSSQSGKQKKANER